MSLSIINLKKIIIKNIGELITNDPEVVSENNPLGIIKNTNLIIEKEKVKEISREIGHYYLDNDTLIIDAESKVVSPGLVDPHTHLVFKGERSKEFALRLKGVNYLEILKQGGGILSTVKKTREASFEELYQEAAKRLNRLIQFGVTTCEIKSGYGLSLEAEKKLLKVVQKLKEDFPITIVSTFLGAHTFPPEFKEREEDYVNLIISEMLPEVKAENLAEQCDVFLEKGVFNLEQARKILTKAKELGFKIKLHAGQFSNIGGCELAAELEALSVDHLEHFSERGLRAMAEKGVIAVLLPGASLSLNMGFPNLEKFREIGVEVALATDCNPGTSYTENLPLMTTLAVTKMKMSIEEAWKGITVIGAKALGLKNKGIIKKGFDADLVVWDMENYLSLPYHFGVSLANYVISCGKLVYQKI